MTAPIGVFLAYSSLRTIHRTGELGTPFAVVAKWLGWLWIAFFAFGFIAYFWIGSQGGWSPVFPVGVSHRGLFGGFDNVFDSSTAVHSSVDNLFTELCPHRTPWRVRTGSGPCTPIACPSPVR